MTRPIKRTITTRWVDEPGTIYAHGSMTRPIKRTITTRWIVYGPDKKGKDEQYEVKADIIHDVFAIHRYRHNDSLWTLTHVPSGYAIANRLRHKKQAKALADELHALGLDWDFMTRDTMPQETLEKSVPVVARYST